MSWLAERGVDLAVRLLPRRMRARYEEQWRADLAGSAEAGVSAWGVASGALLFSATLDRGAPELTGLSVTDTARRRARWGIAFLGSAGVLWFGSFFLGGGTFGAVTVVFTVLALGCAIAGLGQLWRAAVAVNALALVTAVLATAGVLCLIAGGPASGFGSLFLLAGLGLLFAAAVCGAIVAGTVTPSEVPVRQAAASSTRGIVGSLVTAIVLLIGLLAMGAAELLVWGPLAQTQSLTLEEVYAGLGEFDRIQGVTLILIWLIFWAIVVVAFAITASIVRRRSPALQGRTVWSIALAIAAAMVFFQFWAGFSLGMSIADTLPPHRGGISAAGYAYALLGQLALVATIFLVVAPRRIPVGPAGIEPTTSTV